VTDEKATGQELIDEIKYFKDKNHPENQQPYISQTQAEENKTDKYLLTLLSQGHHQN